MALASFGMKGTSNSGRNVEWWLDFGMFDANIRFHRRRAKNLRNAKENVSISWKAVITSCDQIEKSASKLTTTEYEKLFAWETFVIDVVADKSIWIDKSKIITIIHSFVYFTRSVFFCTACVCVWMSCVYLLEKSIWQMR